jgi:cell division protein FtsI/penicillin-binding protein 2
MTYIPNQKQILNQIFKPETAEILKNALFDVLDQNPELRPITHIEWYKLWWKSWTSQISYKGKYQQWIWWTNASFVGISNKRWSKICWLLFKFVVQDLVFGDDKLLVKYLEK